MWISALGYSALLGLSLVSASGEKATEGEGRSGEAFLSELDEFLAGDELLPLLDVPRVWTGTATLSGAVGHRDNVYRGSENTVSAYLARARLEYFLLRAAEDDLDFYAFLTAENSWFFDRSISDERLAMVVAEVRKHLPGDWALGTVFQSYYSEQVMDASADNVEVGVVGLKGMGLRLDPFIHRKFGGGAFVEGGVTVGRSFFQAPLDDFTEMGPTMSIGFGEEWRLEAGYEWLFRSFDTRKAADRDGFAIPNSELTFEIHRAKTVLGRDWGEGNQWWTETGFDVKINKDSGGSFYDYTRYGLWQTVRYRRDVWEMRGMVSVARFEYDVQAGQVGGSKLRSRTTMEFEGSFRRYLTRMVYLSVEYRREQARGDQRMGDYSVDTIIGGLHWEL